MDVRVADVSRQRVLEVVDGLLLSGSGIVNESRYRTKTIPSAGTILKEEDSPDKQQAFEV